MKIYILMLVSIVFASYSCKKTSSSANENLLIAGIVDKNVFSRPLQIEVLKMIGLKEKEQKGNDNIQRICTVVFGAKTDGRECTILITLMSRIIPNKITGYTFIGNELVTCYILSDSCNNYIINRENLLLFKDSISGYPNILKHDNDLIYDAPICVYKIINNDSIQLIKSSFTPFKGDGI